MISFQPVNLHSDHVYLQQQGDSMSPTIGPDDIIEINPYITHLFCDGIYAFTLNGSKHIKRLHRKINGALLIISDIEPDNPYTLSEEQEASLNVVGKVVRIWKETRV